MSLEAEIAMMKVQYQAARILIERKDAQIVAMAEEIERLRATVERHEATIRGLWAELAEGANDAE